VALADEPRPRALIGYTDSRCAISPFGCIQQPCSPFRLGVEDSRCALPARLHQRNLREVRIWLRRLLPIHRSVRAAHHTIPTRPPSSADAVLRAAPPPPAAQWPRQEPRPHSDSRGFQDGNRRPPRALSPNPPSVASAHNVETAPHAPTTPRRT